MKFLLIRYKNLKPKRILDLVAIALFVQVSSEREPRQQTDMRPVIMSRQHNRFLHSSLTRQCKETSPINLISLDCCQSPGRRCSCSHICLDSVRRSTVIPELSPIFDVSLIPLYFISLPPHQCLLICVISKFAFVRLILLRPFSTPYRLIPIHSCALFFLCVHENQPVQSI